MFDRLIESRPHRRHGWNHTLLSAATHAGFLAVVVHASAQPAVTPERREAPIFLPPGQPPIPERHTELRHPVVSVVPEAPIVDTGPIEVLFPVDIPPVIPKEGNDPGRIGSAPVGPLNPGPSTLTPAGTTGETFLEEQVDDPVVLVRGVTPRYPPVWQQAGIEGKVYTLFVVDSLGIVEPGSFRVEQSTNAAFEASAKDAILRSQFRAARVRGRPVRAWARQDVSFRIAQ